MHWSVTLSRDYYRRNHLRASQTERAKDPHSYAFSVRGACSLAVTTPRHTRSLHGESAPRSLISRIPSYPALPLCSYYPLSLHGGSASSTSHLAHPARTAVLFPNTTAAFACRAHVPPGHLIFSFVSPVSAPIATTNSVEQNYMARQIIFVQQKLRDTFAYRPDMDAAYLISSAADLCRDLNVRNPVDIARLLTAELRNCVAIQDVIEEHIASHELDVVRLHRVRLLEFVLSNDHVYAKTTADLTRAFARYTKPPTMDVNEHLTAHLAKEEDLIRRLNVRITPADLHEALYGKEDAREKHLSGSAEDTVMARLLDSLRSSELNLIEHLNRLILFLGESSWTSKALIEAIRSYERKMNSLPASSSSAHGAALIRHYQAKTEARSRVHRPVRIIFTIKLHTVVITGRSPS